MGSPTSERKPAGLTRKKVEATPANQIVNALSAFAIVTGAVESLTYTPQTPDNEPASSEGQQTIIYSASPKSLDDISDFLSNQLELLRLQQQTQPEQPIGPEPTTPQRREFSLNPEVINPNYSTTVDYGPTGIRLREQDSTTSTKLRDLSNTLETRVLGFSINGENINNDSEWVYVEVTLNNGEVLRGYISLGVSRDSFNTPGDQGTLIENAYTKQYAQDLTNLSPRDTVTNSIELNTGGQRDLGSRINTDQKTSAMGKVIENFKTQVLNQIPEELQLNTTIVEVIDLDRGVLELVPIHTDEVGNWLLVQDTDGATHRALIPNGSTLKVISGPSGTTFNLTFEGINIAEMGAGVSFTPNPNLGESIGLDIISQYLAGLAGPDDLRPRFSSIADRKLQEYADANGYTLEEVKEWQQDALLRLHRDLKPLAESGQLQFDPSLRGYVRGSRESGNLHVWRRNMTSDDDVESGWLDIADQIYFPETNTSIILEFNRDDHLNRTSGLSFSDIVFDRTNFDNFQNWLITYGQNLQNTTISFRLVAEYDRTDTNIVGYTIWEGETGLALKTSFESGLPVLKMWSMDASKFRGQNVPFQVLEYTYSVVALDGLKLLNERVYSDRFLTDLNSINSEIGRESTSTMYPGITATQPFEQRRNMFVITQ